MEAFDRQVLKEIAQPGSVEGLQWGAAMSASLGYLQGNGYVTRGERPQITDKGRAAIQETPDD